MAVKMKLWAVLWVDGLGVQVEAETKKKAIWIANRARKLTGAKRSKVKLAQPVIGACRLR